MKFKLVNIGPIKDAEIELGDFTLFLGLPSTGKSFALRSIYTSLVFLDKEYERSLSSKLHFLLRKTALIGIDYVISYILSLLRDEYNICDSNVVENIIKVVVKEHNFDISGTVENNCLIKISERVNLLEKLKNIASLIREEIKDEYLKWLRKSVNYTNNSSIYINGEKVEDLIEKLEMPPIETKDLRLDGLGEFVIPERGEIRYKMNGDYEAGALKINVELEPIIMGKTYKKLSFEEAQTFKPRIIDSFTLRDILPLEKMAKDLIKEYANTVGFIYSIIFIPYGRNALELINEESTSIYSSITSVRERIIAQRFSPLNNLDKSIKNFLFHINNAKEKIRRNEATDSHILSLISEITKTRIKIDERRRILFEMQDGVELEPFYTSAMINEIASILLPLLDLQTPALVLIEEPESQLHLAYQILLLLVLLSLVQHGYKFVITTHGDLMASFLGDLVEYKPSKEKIMELLEKIFDQELPSTLKKIVNDVEKTIKENNIKVYYFENGTAREVPANRLAYEVPGVTRQVVDKVVKWEWELKENE